MRNGGTSICILKNADKGLVLSESVKEIFHLLAIPTNIYYNNRRTNMNNIERGTNK